ncbi:MAG: oxidoreductase [Candidatus Hydrogenedentota bacterium]
MRVAIVGCGVMGQTHAASAAQAGFTVSLCADPVLAKAEELAKPYGAKATDNVTAACGSADVDVVAIATPTPFHVDLVRAAAAAGKNIFCEKPLGRDLDQCNAILSAVKSAGVKLFVGHVVRYFPEYEAMRTNVQNKSLGKAGFVRMFRGGICPQGQGGWFRAWEQSGGVTLDCAIHDFDWLRYVFGDVARVYSQDLRDHFGEGMDYNMTTVRMKNGVIAQVTGSWAHPSGFCTKVEICAENGMIVHNSNEAPIAMQKRVAEVGSVNAVVPGSPTSVSPYTLEWMDFLQWLEGKGNPRVTPEDAVEAVRICLAALESAEKGEPVSL